MSKSFAQMMLASLLVLPIIASAETKQEKNLAEFVPGEVLVKLKSSQGDKSNLSASQEFLNESGLKLKSSFSILGQQVLVVKVSSTLKAIRNLQLNSNVEYVEPNYIYRINGKPSRVRTPPADPRFSELWGLENASNTDIDAIKAWNLTKGSKNIKIAIIDTGIDYNHPDLKDQVWTNTVEQNGKSGVDDDNNGVVDDIHGASFVSGAVSGNPLDDHNHGTHCSGTIAASHNDVGVAGVMANASLIGVKFLSASGSGSTADAVKAIQYATKVGADVMSNSWGGGGFSQTLKDAIDEAGKAGIVFVAAAGNNGSNNDASPSYPASYDSNNIISVGAYGETDQPATFTNTGKRTVHVFAPGVKVLSTTRNNSYAVFSGTSMATPHVSGIVGLYLSKFGKTTPSQIREDLMKSSVKVSVYRNITKGSGRVNAYNLLARVYPTVRTPDPSTWEEVSYESLGGSPFVVQAKYQNNEKIIKSYELPTSKYIQLGFDKFATELNYDFLTITDSSNNVVQKISGTKSAGFKSDSFKTKSFTLTFTSDDSGTGEGLSSKVLFVNDREIESPY